MGQLRERLAELRGKGMSQEEALFTAANEGLINPNAAKRMLQVGYAAGAPAQDSAPPVDSVRAIQPSQVPPQPGAPGPAPQMPPSFPPSGPPQGSDMPAMFMPSGRPVPGMEALPNEDQRLLAKRRAMIQQMQAGQQPSQQMDPSLLLAILGKR